MNLLTQNTKLKKDPRYLVWGLDLSPHKSSGYNTCKFAGVCKEICIGEHSGFNKMSTVRKAKEKKTRFFFEDRQTFLQLLHKDLQKLESIKDNRLKFVRLNVDSDIPWEAVDISLFNYDLQFYDYSKYVSRAKNTNVDNYQITYSWNELSELNDVRPLLKSGKNISLVTNIQYTKNNKEFPSEIKLGRTWYPTVDGDLSDVRHSSIDGEGKVILLRAKIKKSLIPTYVEKGFFVEPKFRN